MSAKQSETIVESGTEIFIPLNKLKKSPKNARKTPHSEASIEAYAASIAAKGATEGSLGINDPLGLAQRRKMSCKGPRISQLGVIAEEAETAGLVGSDELREEQPAKQPEEHAHRKKESRPVRPRRADRFPCRPEFAELSLNPRRSSVRSQTSRSVFRSRTSQ
jgi:hypothetical protein